MIGAGAAGLAAAIFAAEEAARAAASAPGRAMPRIVVLEGARKIGAKILVSGGGRCNVTHDQVSADDFNGARNPIRNVLAAFDADAAKEWFASLGVALKREDTGKLFPVSDSARSVVDALVSRCRALGVELHTRARVTSLARDGDGDDGAFVVAFERGGATHELRARRVILTTGGRSLPRTGSDGGGYALARALGHTVTDTHPALVPLVLARGFFHAELRGISHEAELTTLANGKRVDRRSGSLLWTHFGISGPVVLDASRHWVLARARGDAVELRMSVLPGKTAEDADAWLQSLARERPRASLGRLLAGVVPERLADALLHAAEVDPATQAGQLARDARRRLVRCLTELPLPVERDRGWDFAEVTAGGVPLAEVDFRTMASRRADGLFLAGEILDCEGRIGGFNFQWAWATGFLAGRAAVRSLWRMQSASSLTLH
ncbi:MAG: NAD(P)/FAD-dependent oxidoreductase [Candidatus Binatia bacterium]